MNTKELATSLRSVNTALHKSLRRQADPVKAYSMTEVETIGYLARNTSLLPTELAALTRITTQSMSQILKKLEEQGIIKRSPSKEDKRKVFIFLTSFGKKMVEKVQSDKVEWLKNAIEKSLTGKEKDILEKALPVLAKLI